ncbi:MAG: DUF2600 family protein [Conexibacter sp.]
MHATRQCSWSAAGDAFAVIAALMTYTLVIVPQVRHELRRWEGIARSIPDPALREHALTTLGQKALNAEAAAVFGILAPRRSRTRVVMLMVAFQVLTDYLDTVSEQPAPDVLRNGIALHLALIDALRAQPPALDYYRHYARDDDGGYVERLVHACRQEFAALPAARAVRKAALAAARRCGEGQSHTHAAVRSGSQALARWAQHVPAGKDYLWWEVAAGASSSVPVHALLAAAADPRTSRAEAERIDAAYFPSIGALTVLLDNLVDRDDDVATGNHNYLGYYRSSSFAATRLAEICTAAATGVRTPRRARRHAAILAGVAGFYLSAREADTPYASVVKARIIERGDTALGPILAVMRIRRGLAARHARRSLA